MNIRHKGLEIIKGIFFPVVFLVRACRAYKQMKNWRKNIVGGYISVSPQIPQGIFTIDIRSALANLMFNDSYEELIMRFLTTLKLRDGMILNIGANVGLYAVHLAKIFPRSTVLAIEPNPEAYALLVQNIRQNGLIDRIQTVNACISSSKGKVKLHTIPGKSEYSSMNGIVHFSVSNKKQSVIEVDSFRLSDIIGKNKSSFIFMDVEGAEHVVLEGGEDILLRDHPTIICECSNPLLEKFNSSSKKLVSFLKELGYTVKNVDSRKTKINHPLSGNIIAIYPSDLS